MFFGFFRVYSMVFSMGFLWAVRRASGPPYDARLACSSRTRRKGEKVKKETGTRGPRVLPTGPRALPTRRAFHQMDARRARSAPARTLALCREGLGGGYDSVAPPPPLGGINAPADAETSSKIALSILFCMVFSLPTFAADTLRMHYSLHISCTFTALFLPLPRRLHFSYSPISYHISRPSVNRAAHPDRATAFTLFRPQQLLSDAFFAGLWSKGDVRRGGQEGRRYSYRRR